MATESEADRDRYVARLLLIEGVANTGVLILKAAVGWATGSVAILGDAIHSLTDVANNGVAWWVVRIARRPPDAGHPYGHRKFETVAVFGLAMLMVVLAVELAGHALRRDTAGVVETGWAAWVMGGVLALNVALAAWQSAWARRLGSDLLRADARHTVADVLTTLVVIGGWQAAARGAPWVDTLAALLVAVLILVLAYGLFRQAIPILVDAAPIDAGALVARAAGVPGIVGVRDVRSRGHRRRAAVELSVAVAPHLDTAASHDLATQVEEAIRRAFEVEHVIVHVEPAGQPSKEID